MRTIIRSISTFLNTDSIKRAEETYLNGSLDRIDLEYRQREIDRGLFRTPSYRSMHIR